MTDRPMTEGERVRILQWAQRFADDCAAPGSTPPLHASGDAMLDVCLALLSTSAAVRGMREKGLELIQALNTHDIGASLHGQAYTDVVGAKNLLSAALSGIEGEDEQARSPSALSAPASTVSKDTTK